ncbi:serine beta-lactamase-like protein LACTB, mitochondrial [Oppia nitens]|uniref:serine beta-lactamase-like protein LACTB, mitochondrial n=1 Tax=Oppia nitens TaxID=1686743 RepID=UPI0023DA347D|nr:serine beta-lactamase-like protein LACTB, mitochondrial [Oppia nitens]
MTNHTIPGSVVAFSINGKTVWSESFGLADIENNVPTHVDSPWRLCSISKSLTSALVGQLIDRKILNLDKPITDYLPLSLFPVHRYNGTAYTLTLRLVMSHLAGLHVTKIPDDLTKFYRALNITETIELFNNEPLLYRPGSEFQYSNYGYQLLGAVIESVTHENYDQQMAKLFAKLDMRGTGVEKREQLLKHRPRYYSQSSDNKPTELENGDLSADLFSYEGWWSAGGILSTVTDLLKFGNAMIRAYHGTDQSIVSKSVIRELWKPETIGKVKPSYMKYMDYGKAWFISNMNASYPYRLVVGHSGGLPGVTTQLLLFPEQNIVGVVFANKDDLDFLDLYIQQVAENFQNFL